jgi:hypothetical protein
LKKASFLLFAVLVFSGCSSHHVSQFSFDNDECRAVQQTPQKNGGRLADELLKDCLDKKQQQQEKNQGSGFWRETFKFALSFLDAVRT